MELGDETALRQSEFNGQIIIWTVHAVCQRIRERYRLAGVSSRFINGVVNPRGPPSRRETPIDSDVWGQNQKGLLMNAAGLAS